MKNAKSREADLIWVPAQGPDERARQRLIDRFPRPTEPMGEAWFMSHERKLFPEALDSPVEDLDLALVEAMFDQITCGPPCFGQLEEWRSWFHYFLPHLIPRAYAQPSLSYVMEWLASGMFSQYPDGLKDAPYPAFRTDLFEAFGSVLMSDEVWETGRLKWSRGLFYKRRRYGEESWYLDEVSPAISVMLFFALKYLYPNQIEAWLRSVISIDCPLWRAQVIVWLIGARALLVGEVSQPHQLGETNSPVQWNWSHVYLGNYTGEYDNVHSIPFIPEVNLAAFREAARKILPSHVRQELKAAALSVPLIAEEMSHLAEQFIDLDLLGEARHVQLKR